MATQFDNLLSPKKGAYSKSQIVDRSYYDVPVDKTEGRLAGNSRIAGDASHEVQIESIKALQKAAKASDLDDNDTALLLAIIRTESGFNPDAAAGTTSAHGLGQLVDGTAKNYGVTDDNRWNLETQAQAAADHYIDCYNKTVKLGQDSSHIYALWHDGLYSGGNGVGLPISNNNVMPYVPKFYNAITNAGTYSFEQNGKLSRDDFHAGFANIAAQLKSSGFAQVEDKKPEAYDEKDLAAKLQKVIDGVSNVADNNPDVPQIRGEQPSRQISSGNSI